MDRDNDGILDHIDLDDDNDGILDVDEGGPSSESLQFYQINGLQLTSINIQTGEVSDVGDPANFQFDSLAYDDGGTSSDLGDDVLYASVRSTGTDSVGTPVNFGDLISIDPATGETTRVVDMVIEQPGGGTIPVGTVGAATFYDGAYIIRDVSNDGLISIDPATGIGTILPESDNFLPNDFVNIDGVYYGTAFGNLYSYDTNAIPPDVEIDTLTGFGGTSNGFGSAWVIEDDRLLVQNNNGDIFEVTGYDTGSPTITLFLETTDPGQNDGASLSSMTIPVSVDTDGDGIFDHEDLDSDNDGITDIVEGGVDASLYDTDGNGTIDADEIVDTNEDGLDDRIDAADGALDGQVSGPLDTDGDGIADYLDLDSDNDGISDLEEAGVNPALDGDGDGVIDTAADNSGGLVYNDSNNDGLVDILQTPGSDLTPADSDNDGIADNIDLDSDNDGISDYIESQSTDDFVPFDDTDSDGDGIIDLVDDDTGPDAEFGGNFTAPIDTDNDGDADVIDEDSDGDGVSDSDESGLTSSGSSTDGIDDGSAVTFEDQDGQPANSETGVDGLEDYLGNDADNDTTDVDFRSTQDSDGDGIADFEDLDDDNDGILDADEGTGDSDGDGIIDSLDLDSDNDGISDLEESGLDPDIFDTDGDGQVNGSDFVDENDDGLADNVDALDGTPLDGNTNDAVDTDSDGVDDYLDLDSDNDGISDLQEAGVNPALDVDSDGIIDINPDGSAGGEAADTNRDGLADLLQDPNVDIAAVDTDNDGIADFRDLDSDDDGISDFIEALPTEDFVAYDATDSDGDGIIDLVDADNGPSTEFGGDFTAPIDTNNDGEADYIDTDSDGDGDIDSTESGLTTSGSSTNGIDDGSNVTFTDQDGQAGNIESGVDGLEDYLTNTVDADTTDVDFRSIPCFTRGTKIVTRAGEKRVEELSVGDKVLTMDAGFQPVSWVGSRLVTSAELEAHPKLNPVLIKAGALGEQMPTEDLLVSRQHRVLVRSAVAERMFGEREVLIPAIKLTGLEGVQEVQAIGGLEYFHILFERHQIVFSNGAQTESLFTGREALKTLSKEAIEEIQMLFPDILHPDYQPQAARKIVSKGKHITELCERLAANQKQAMEFGKVAEPS